MVQAAVGGRAVLFVAVEHVGGGNDAAENLRGAVESRIGMARGRPSPIGRQWVDMEEFNLLEDLRIVSRVKDGHVTTAAGYFRFNRGIRESHRASHNKPVQLEVVVGFRGGIAQVLYVRKLL